MATPQVEHGRFAGGRQSGFVIRPGTALAIAPVTGLIYFLVGVHTKYRGRYSPREALWAFPLAISFFGSMVVMSTTALV